MPHVSSSGGGDDLGSEDEVKVFKDEGEEEKRSSENLTEDKSDLIDLTESEVRIVSFVLFRIVSCRIPAATLGFSPLGSSPLCFVFRDMYSSTHSPKYPCSRHSADAKH